MFRQASNAALVCLLALVLPIGSLASRRQLAVRRLSTQLAAAPLRATQYYGLVHVGKPAQEFRVVFDTCSGQLILPSAQCDDEACTSHRRLGNSTTAVQIGWADDPTKAIADGDDRDMKSLSLLGTDVTGVFVRDNICVGDAGHSSCGVADFVALTEESDEPFLQLGFDGVLGLSPTSPDASEFNVLAKMAQGHRVFAVYLSPVFGSGNDGEISFGGYRKERMASKELMWVPVSNNGTWQILVDDISVGGKSLGFCGKAGCQAVVDTGSSLLMMPGNMLWQLTKTLDVDEECTKDPPSIEFTVGGQKLALGAEDYLERSESDGCALALGTNGGAGKGPALILGYPFLRKYYTVFDLDNNRVGIALAKHDAKSAPKDDLATVKLVGLRP